MKVKFWGTRGSIPTPGPGTVRYGGNTPCLEVRPSDDELLIFDAGTGIRALGETLVSNHGPMKAHLALSHHHWDHIQGFPFFKPLFLDGYEFTIIGPETERLPLNQVISDIMDKVYFPVQMHELKARLSFLPIAEESHPILGGTLSACLVNHPSFALGYRFDHRGRSLVYISDNEPFDPANLESSKNVDRNIVEKYMAVKGDPNRRVSDFAKGADVFIHDSTYTPEEYRDHVGWGHSHYEFSLKLAHDAGARTLVLFHHDQLHSDDVVDGIVQRCRELIRERGYSMTCVAAEEGVELEV